jgi:hypothetical protein
MLAQDELHHFRGADFAEPMTRRAAAGRATGVHPRTVSGDRSTVEHHVASALAGVTFGTGDAWLAPAVADVDEYRLGKQGSNAGVCFLAHCLLFELIPDTPAALMIFKPH